MSADKTVFDPGETEYENSATVYDDAATVPDSAATQFDGGSMTAAALFDAAKQANVPASDLSFKKGSTIIDTYRVESDPIHGGMGSVWRVHHGGWNTDLAMKRPQPHCFSTEKSKANFIHECEAWINLGLHPNIVSCYYVREIEGTPSIFSEWMDGGSLESAISKGTLYKGTADEQKERLLDIAIQFARGLYYAHDAGLIHRDVKPDNLLLTKEGEAKVADFGIARARAALTALEGDPTMQGNTDGTMISASGAYTPAYCSMEQMDGKPLTRRTDIYSWAVSVMEMYIGSRPWANGVVAGLSCRDYFEDTRLPMPEALKKLLAGCMETEPGDRPHDFAEVENELQKIYKAETGSDYPRPAPRPAANTAGSLNNMALSMLDLGKPEEADKLWEQALKRAPRHQESIFNRGTARWRQGIISDQALLTELEDQMIEVPEAWVKALLCERGIPETEDETASWANDVKQPKFDDDSATCHAVSSDGKLEAYGMMGGRVCLWDVKSHSRIFESVKPDPLGERTAHVVKQVAFTENNDYVLAKTNTYMQIDAAKWFNAVSGGERYDRDPGVNLYRAYDVHTGRCVCTSESVLPLNYRQGTPADYKLCRIKSSREELALETAFERIKTDVMHSVENRDLTKALALLSDAEDIKNTVPSGQLMQLRRQAACWCRKEKPIGLLLSQDNEVPERRENELLEFVRPICEQYIPAIADLYEKNDDVERAFAVCDAFMSPTANRIGCTIKLREHVISSGILGEYATSYSFMVLDARSLQMECCLVQLLFFEGIEPRKHPFCFGQSDDHVLICDNVLSCTYIDDAEGMVSYQRTWSYFSAEYTFLSVVACENIGGIIVCRYPDVVVFLDASTGGELFHGFLKSKAYNVKLSDDRMRLYTQYGDDAKCYDLDWELSFPGWTEWNERARPCLKEFLLLHPDWTEDDFNGLIGMLQNRGFGYIRPEGVRAKLMEMKH